MSREIYWNISTTEVVLMYLAVIAAVAIMVYGVWKRVQYWLAGKPPDEPWTDWGKRAVVLLQDTFLQARVLREKYPGLFHGLIFYSFLWLLLTTATIFLHEDFGIHIFRGPLYLVLSLGADLGGLALLLGLLMAAWRRYVTRPKSLDRRWADAYMLLALGFIVVTGFLVEGARIASTGEEYAAFSPVGVTTAALFAGMAHTSAGHAVHKVLWWIHLLSAMTFIASIPYSKFFHLLSLPTNVFLANISGHTEVRRVDLDAMMEDEDFDEENFSLGIGTAADFQLVDRMDHDACIECGRCEEVCPAARAGDPFSPKKFIQGLRDYGHAMLEKQKALEAQREARKAAGEEAEDSGEEVEGLPPIIGGILDENFPWYCRTCRACMEVCPARIDHVTQFIEVRRNEVMMQGRLPEEAQQPLRQLETMGNAFGNQEDRVEWFERAGFPVVEEGEEVEVLYYVGCLTSFDNTKQKIAEDMAKILDAAGVKWGVLGEDETCCGEPARALGNEMLYQMQAKTQLEAIQARKFKVILTTCPHCQHNLKNEYRAFGAELPVVHHSEFIQQLLAEGRIRLDKRFEGKLTYHDPCYLGRYQGQYDAPRSVLQSVPGVQVLEMRDNREKALCCGGGGHFWMDFRAEKRINNLRMEQAVETGADTVAVACPYCMQMLNDSVAMMDLDEKERIEDIATLVARALAEQDGGSKRGDGEASAEA